VTPQLGAHHPYEEGTALLISVILQLVKHRLDRVLLLRMMVLKEREMAARVHGAELQLLMRIHASATMDVVMAIVAVAVVVIDAAMAENSGRVGGRSSCSGGGAPSYDTQSWVSGGAE